MSFIFLTQADSSKLIDHQKTGIILDDELHAILVAPLPPGVRLFAIMDCCHSGTALDLPYIYSSEGVLKSYDPMKEIVKKEWDKLYWKLLFENQMQIFLFLY